MTVSFEGIGEKIVTFYNSDTASAAAGLPVKMSGNGQVCACAAGDRFIGVAAAADSSFAAVKNAGYVKLPYTGSAPAVGFAKLAAAGNGAVTDAETGGEYLVVDVDTAGETVGIIL
mgnify:FL=1